MRLLRTTIAVTSACVLLPLSGTGSAGASPAQSDGAQPMAAQTKSTLQTPGLRVRPVVGNLDIPWDLDFLPSGAMIYTERERKRIWWRSPNGKRKRVVANSPAGIWASGETGLMSILVARNFKKSRAFYTCHGAIAHGRTDVRVVRWRLNKKATKAMRKRVVVKGIPATTGRHGGCRLRFGKGRTLFIGTGDAATSRNPQSKRSLGGKVLRVRPWTGRAIKSNPFYRSDRPKTRKIWTYGHRNVQGLARRRNGQMWSVEHGSYRDDEVNRLRRGGNYGWDPGPGYDESVPMTDHSLPGKQIGAKWRSGNPTVATSGATWIHGKKWGRWNGALAVAALKDSSLRIMKFGPKGKLRRVWRPAKLADNYGRLRSVVMGPRHTMFITTSNGGGNDRILRVRPRS